MLSLLVFLPPPPGLVPSCAEVFSRCRGSGAIQANEATGRIPAPATLERSSVVRRLKMKFREPARKNPDCPVCGANPTLTELIDYEEFCGIRGEEVQPDVSVPTISVKDLKQRMDAGEDVVVLDVREPHEYKICNIGGLLIPLGELAARVTNWTGRDIVVHATGVALRAGVEFLQDAGFERGGICIHARSDETTRACPGTRPSATAISDGRRACARAGRGTTIRSKPVVSSTGPRRRVASRVLVGREGLQWRPGSLNWIRIARRAVRRIALILTRRPHGVVDFPAYPFSLLRILLFSDVVVCHDSFFERQARRLIMGIVTIPVRALLVRSHAA